MMILSLFPFFPVWSTHEINICSRAQIAPIIATIRCPYSISWPLNGQMIVYATWKTRWQQMPLARQLAIHPTWCALMHVEARMSTRSAAQISLMRKAAFFFFGSAVYLHYTYTTMSNGFSLTETLSFQPDNLIVLVATCTWQLECE